MTYLQSNNFTAPKVLLKEIPTHVRARLNELVNKTEPSFLSAYIQSVHNTPRL